MNIAVTFKHIDSSDAIKQYAESKVLKLEKYLNNIMEAHVTLSIERVDHKESGVAQIKLSAKNLIVNAEEKSADIYSAIDLLLEKVESQIKKHKEKIRRKEHIEEGAGISAADEDIPNLEVKDDYERQPLNVKEAMRKLEKRNKDFIIFKDKESSKISFIFRGEDGEFSLITPEL
ncbi:MAG: ribosome-associated translation inhibitor RaiA [Deltaproteobacteria bacterium]|jgi:putative sigma-54 modulation protein|nr:ribosome-associated translation inhibitor RaiA [Deltaproteobacteria bacterium]